MRRNAQAALEFMLTYGWALLLLAALVGGLVYFVPKTDTMTANKCIFGSELSCLGTRLDNASLQIVLHNNLGQTIYNVTASLSQPINVACYVTNTTDVSADDSIKIICPNANGISVRSDIRIKANVTYKKSRSGYLQIVNGDIYAKYNICTGAVLYRITNGGVHNNIADAACCSSSNMCVSDGVCYDDGVSGFHPSWDPGYAPGYDCYGPSNRWTP